MPYDDLATQGSQPLVNKLIICGRRYLHDSRLTPFLVRILIAKQKISRKSEAMSENIRPLASIITHIFINNVKPWFSQAHGQKVNGSAS